MDDNHSGISKHVSGTGHSVAWKDVQILAYETDWRSRKIKEVIFIEKSTESILNTKPGAPLSNVHLVLRYARYDVLYYLYMFCLYIFLNICFYICTCIFYVYYYIYDLNSMRSYTRVSFMASHVS